MASADHFFESRESLFDAMPVVWKNLTEDQRREVVNLLDQFVEKNKTDPKSGVWEIDNV